MDKAGPVFLQLGAVGAIALILLGAVRVLYTRAMDEMKESIARETAARDRETARADRLEQELRELNAAVRSDVIPVVTDARRAIEDGRQVVQNALAQVRGS